MSKPKQPWMKFYPADWRADTALRMCDPLSRYVWLEMIGIMHEAVPYGHLVINGNPVTDTMLSKLADVPLKAIKLALKELGRAGVFSVTDGEIIFSRRMVRDDLKARSNKDNGGKGGNPVLINQGLSDSSDNPKDNQVVKAHIPDTRYQIPDKEKISSNEDIAPTAFSLLCEVVDADHSKAILAHRKSIKKPLTVFAAKLLAGKLSACPDPNAAADEMILSGWARIDVSWLQSSKTAATGPPRYPKSEFRQHQDDCREAIDREIQGTKHDEFTGNTINH